MDSSHWTGSEKKVAKAAYDTALQRELDALLLAFKQRAASAETVESVWEIKDWLEQRQRDIDRTYDYRYSQLVFVFARLIRRGTLDASELAGLSVDKLDEIAFMTTRRD